MAGGAGGLLGAYDSKVREGGLTADPAQRAVAGHLATLAEALESWRPQRTGLFGLFRKQVGPAPRGLYVYGAVGRGKTMLMDLFFADVKIAPKRRVHFHQFMAETHTRIATARKTAAGDPIPIVAKELAAQARLLCFDELHVTDIADAMILGRLFKVLFADDVVVVATSNARPDELYRNGLNRQLFLPFIDLIEDHMQVVELAAARDFRLARMVGRRLYFTPLGGEAKAGMDALWQALTGGEEGQPATLDVGGRRLAVPRQAGGVARFAFAELCEGPLGAGDYLEIARTYQTVMLDDVPVMTPADRNAARRFVTLIDTLYDSRIGLALSAAAEPDELYVAGDGAYLFERTASRLIEMRSADYIAARADGEAATAPR